ncbi:hypothetical protein [Desulfosporosinus acidiphilus]|uniref:hypothetical protein n=1 Tax=Desulfosporosinus acidiphilus TaxID=885581 RepID=UPI000257ADD4|nr:hypothetical protein [Desulfosporosinus acidiphilus]
MIIRLPGLALAVLIICSNTTNVPCYNYFKIILFFQNWQAINQMTLNVEKKLFSGEKGGNGKDRHLFAWSHTPQGKVQYIDTLLNDISTLYTL